MKRPVFICELLTSNLRPPTLRSFKCYLVHINVPFFTQLVKSCLNVTNLCVIWRTCRPSAIRDKQNEFTWHVRVFDAKRI